MCILRSISSSLLHQAESCSCSFIEETNSYDLMVTLQKLLSCLTCLCLPCKYKFLRNFECQTCRKVGLLEIIMKKSTCILNADLSRITNSSEWEERKKNSEALTRKQYLIFTISTIVAVFSANIWVFTCHYCKKGWKQLFEFLNIFI